MNRQIKFRGKRLDTGVWVYGDIIKKRYIHSSDHLFAKATNGGVIEYIEVDSDTVGQFTGLVDSEGEEVYEGDIVEFGDDDMDVLMQSSEVTYFIKDKYPSFDLHGVFDFECNALQHYASEGHLKVIGKKYDRHKEK